MIVGRVYSGTQFNRLSKGKKYYKLTNEIEIHYGFKFKDGLNVDTVKFNPTGECSAGGIYFTDRDNFDYWKDEYFYYRMVTIPDNAQVIC